MRSRDVMDRMTEGAFRTRELIVKQPLLELCGEHRILIENHNGVEAYSSERINVKTRSALIRITGSNLEICRMSVAQLVIIGNIKEITLFKGGEK